MSERLPRNDSSSHRRRRSPSESSMVDRDDERGRRRGGEGRGLVGVLIPLLSVVAVVLLTLTGEQKGLKARTWSRKEEHGGRTLVQEKEMMTQEVQKAVNESRGIVDEGSRSVAEERTASVEENKSGGTEMNGFQRTTAFTDRREYLIMVSPLYVKGDGKTQEATEVFIPQRSFEDKCFVGARNLKNIDQCNHVQELVWSNGDWKLANGSASEKPVSWFREQNSSCRWIPGTSMLLRAQNAWANIAHSMGFIFFAYNLNVYRNLFGETGMLDRIVLETHPNIEKELDKPELYLTEMLKLLFEPLPLRRVSSWGQVTSDAAVYLLPSGQIGAGQTGCFQRALVPAFLKARYFIYKEELVGSPIPRPPKAPESSTQFRARLQKYLGISSMDAVPRLVYLARQRRREFDSESEETVVKVLQSVAQEHHWEFSRILFDGLGFADQAKAIYNASLAVGLHGANLVNTIFMAPGSGLLEIFPYQVRYPTSR
uniref:Glycosyltransferase 61 catalytic domain-containing protein n=1 Tax=Compsopogon caeruleus TaxID=31354 RepID=A0A7S1T9A8_9RHOD|mmetsp:Transcript_13142/g.26655  ORF Transcript_13142/g.26655 Transcript_13142/m.26655 type:complete len:485 (+) Transcript_13142:77-1531(+)